jgi:hypothetical protein
LDELYDRFTPVERFRLTIEALARGDEQEAELLSDSCPRRTYAMNDLAYGDRIRGSLQITMMVCLDLGPLLATLQMIDIVRANRAYIRAVCLNEAHRAYLDGYLAGIRRVWRVTGMEGDLPRWHEMEYEEANEETLDSTIAGDIENVGARLDEGTSDFFDFLDELEDKVIVEVRTVWEAFVGFCDEEIEFAPETLLKAYFKPLAKHIKEMQALIGDPSGPKSATEDLNEYRSALSSAWTTLTRQVVG